MKSGQTYSVIVETENLGMAELGDLESSLNSLKAQTYPVNQLKEVVLIVGGHVSPAIVEKITKKYPWVKIHMADEHLDYAKSKMLGASIAKGSVVIFADSDMQYEKTWLKNMIETISTSPTGTIVSGDTRLETNSAYRMAMNCTWMIQILTDKIDQPVPTSYFPLNNFAIEKNIMRQMPIPVHLPLYRNKIPIWERQLILKGYRVVRAPGTRGFHAPPGTLGDWWYRLLIYGADFVAQADFSVTDNGQIQQRQNLPKRLLRLLFLVPWKIEQLLLNSFKLLREDWRRMRYLPGAVLIALANCAVIAIGGMIALFNRDYVFKKINAREAGHVV